MNTPNSYKHWIEILPIPGSDIVFTLFTLDINTNILVYTDYAIPDPIEIGMPIHDYIDANFDMVAAQSANIEKLPK
jgi:hypothetical protein